MKKKKIKMKKPMKIIATVCAVILGILLITFIAYKITETKLRSVGYSKKAAYSIITKFKVSYVLDFPKNKTLNAAFESKDYDEKNLEHYTKITYKNYKNFIKNINTFIKKKYSDREINMLLNHGDSDSINEFADRKRVKYLEEFFSYDYAKLKNYDRYISYMNENGDDEETTIIKDNLDLDKADYTDPVKVNDHSKYVLANKHHYLGSKYAPKNLIVVPEEYRLTSKVIKGTNEAVGAAITMIKDASKEDLNILINSGYRSYSEQEDVYNTYKNLYGESYCLKYVAYPGYSEHQTGYSFDFASAGSKVFVNSEEYKWMLDNAYKYGFIHRYPKSKEDITGISNEAWHFRYVGKKAAKIIYEEGLSFEEYYAIYLDK